LWSGVARPGTDELVGLVLFDGMAEPADGAAQGKKRHGVAGGQLEDLDQCGQGQVQVVVAVG